MLDRSLPPSILCPDQFVVQRPECLIFPNGVELNVLPDADSEVVRIDVVVAGGRWHQSQPLQALFANRLLREGTQSYTAARIAEQLDYYGALLELSSSSEYAYLTLYTLTRHLSHTLPLLESMLKEPLYPADQLAIVIENNIQRFRVNSSKVDFNAHRAFVSALFGPGHPCGRIVEEDDYRNLTPDVLREFYRRYYHSRGIKLFVSGGVDNNVLHMFESAFGTEPFGYDFRPAEKQSFRPISSSDRRIHVSQADAFQSAVRIGQLSIRQAHPDYLKARVLLTLFGGYFGSRLMQNVREQKGYTYGISAGIMAYPDYGMLVISAETAHEYVEPLIREVYHEIDRLQNDLVSVEELRQVQHYMAGELCRNYESVFSLSDAWIFVYVSGASESYFSDALAAIRTITPEEIRSLACRYLQPDVMKEVVCGA